MFQEDEQTSKAQQFHENGKSQTKFELTDRRKRETKSTKPKGFAEYQEAEREQKKGDQNQETKNRLKQNFGKGLDFDSTNLTDIPRNDDEKSGSHGEYQV